MISFVICEDEKPLAQEYKTLIDRFMMQYDYDYKCHYFKGYDTKFENFARKNKDFKIYILDIKTNHGSGLDAARLIREDIDDWTSVIIMITAFNEYKYDALSKRLMLLDFISKLDNYKYYLKDCLERSIKYYNTRPSKLRYTYKNSIYNIDFKNIVYINKEVDSKRCIIYTDDDKSYPYQGTIIGLLEQLDTRFIKTSRSTIINIDHISYYNTLLNKLVFKTGDSITDISRDQKRNLVNCVRGIK